MKRFVAILVAIALIAGAYLIRRAIDGGDGSAEPTTDGNVGTDRRIICATELAQFCRDQARDGSLEGWSVSVEAPGATADRLSQDSGTTVNWLTPKVWVDVVDERRTRASRPTLPDASKVLGRTGLSLVLSRTPGATSTASKCGDPAEWRCVGDAAQAGLRLGLGLNSSTGGLLSTIAATGGFVGGETFATNDIDIDPDYDAWIRQLGAERRADPVTVLVTAPGTYDAAVDLTVAVTAIFEERGDDDGFSTRSLQPPVTADVVLVGGDGIDTATIGTALVRAGWSAPTDSKLPRSSRLPPPGVVDALLSR